MVHDVHNSLHALQAWLHNETVMPDGVEIEKSNGKL